MMKIKVALFFDWGVKINIIVIFIVIYKKI